MPIIELVIRIACFNGKTSNIRTTLNLSPLGMPNNSRTIENIGFITVTEHAKYGLVGGYLVLNTAGRPLEFHCTSPVKPNRAQEILYGQTLKPYLYGEQIAGTLLSRVKAPIGFVMTDVAAVLAAQDVVDWPIGYIFSNSKKKSLLDTVDDLEQDATEDSDEKNSIEITEELNESLKAFGIENERLHCASDEQESHKLQVPALPGLKTEHWKPYRIGNRTIGIPGTNDEERRQLLEDMKNVSRTVDLAEPFTRIRLAIEEAQRAA